MNVITPTGIKEMTAEEIAEWQQSIADAPAPEPTPDERIAALEEENHLLSQHVTALTDQNDFQEELIVELANIVYA